MKKQFFFSLLAFLALGVFCSCSKDKSSSLDLTPPSIKSIGRENGTLIANISASKNAWYNPHNVNQVSLINGEIGPSLENNLEGFFGPLFINGKYFTHSFYIDDRMHPDFQLNNANIWIPDTYWVREEDKQDPYNPQDMIQSFIKKRAKKGRVTIKYYFSFEEKKNVDSNELKDFTFDIDLTQ